MKKMAIIVDSFCGYDEKYFKENYQDVYFFPLQLNIKDKWYQEGIDKLPDLDWYIKNSENPKTSLPAKNKIEDTINEISNNYENVVCLFINSKLSGTYNLIKNEFKNNEEKSKINYLVFDNHFVLLEYKKLIDDIFEMSKNNKSIVDIENFLLEEKKKIIGYIVPGTLSSFSRSGRLKGIKKYITQKYKLIIKVYEGLKISGISRTFNGSIDKILIKIDDFVKDVENMTMDDYEYIIIHAGGNSVANKVEEYLSTKNIKIKVITEATLSTTIHTGINSIYFGIIPKNYLS